MFTLQDPSWAAYSILVPVLVSLVVVVSNMKFIGVDRTISQLIMLYSVYLKFQNFKFTSKQKLKNVII